MNGFVRKHKMLVAIISILLIGALIFGIYWQVTAPDRRKKGYMDSCDSALNGVRTGDALYISWFLPDDLIADAEMQAFLVEKIDEMFENKEFPLLYKFLRAIETDTQYDSKERGMYSYLKDAVTENFEALTTPEDALRVVNEMKVLEYFDSELVLSKDSGVIAAYIADNGINTFTTTPGEGYYADKEDDSSSKRIGIEGSKLRESKSVTHKGDFRIVHESGVRLNRTTYKEQSYSRSNYYFRDNAISFSPDAGECIWSGEYLFCFDFDGRLMNFDKVK